MTIFAKRASAYALDLLLIWLCAVAVMSAFVVTRALLAHLPPEEWHSVAVDARTQLVARILHLFFYCSYFTFCHWYWGQTLGKKTFTLTVTSNDNTELSFWQSFLRTLGYVVNTSFTLGIGFIMAYYREDGKGLHDLLAKTSVKIQSPPIEQRNAAIAA